MRLGVRTAAVVVLAAAGIVAAACGLAGDDDGDNGDTAVSPDATPTATIPPELALAYWVQRRLNQGFVANCDDAQRPDDVGKQCARFMGERDDLLAYAVGPTFSEYTRLFILMRAGDGWTIAGLQERDPGEPAVPGVPWPLRAGATVVVTGTGDCLRVRERPGLKAPEVVCLDDGTTVTISSGPVEIDGYEWWELEGWGGWSAANWLRYPEDAPAEPTPTPAP